MFITLTTEDLYGIKLGIQTVNLEVEKISYRRNILPEDGSVVGYPLEYPKPIFVKENPEQIDQLILEAKGMA